MSKTTPCRKVYKFRMEPTEGEAFELERTASVARYISNWGLERCQQYYQQSGKSKTELWLYDFDSQMLQQALADLRRAYINFFERRARFPKFKKKRTARQSFRIRRPSSAPNADTRTTTFRSPIGSATCPGCRTHHLRDANAAKNVRVEGLRIVAEGHPETVNACGLRLRRAEACIAG